MQSKFLVENEKKNCKPYPPLNPKKWPHIMTRGTLNLHDLTRAL